MYPSGKIRLVFYVLFNPLHIINPITQYSKMNLPISAGACEKMTVNQIGYKENLGVKGNIHGTHFRW